MVSKLFINNATFENFRFLHLISVNFDFNTLNSCSYLLIQKRKNHLSKKPTWKGVSASAYAHSVDWHMNCYVYKFAFN